MRFLQKRANGMRILFATSAAPKISPFSTSEKRPPLGIGSLMALARQAGYEVFFIDNYLKPTDFIQEGFLQKNKVDHVGVYANTICFRNTLRMFTELEDLRKKREWQGKILVGGPHTSVALETIPDFVDYVVQGEGENALIDILEGRETSRVIKGRRVENLDSLPFQPWDIFATLPYDKTCPWINETPIFTMNTSRGCPFKCAFCSVGSVWGSQYVFQGPERILAEMEHLIRNYGARGFYFREDHFTLSLKRTTEFCELLLSKGVQTQWACETRVDRMTEDLVKLMAASGCKAVYLGVESGSPRILEMMNKNITIEQIENAVRWCRKYGVNTYCSMIVGVPGETYEDFLQSEALIKRLRPYSYSYSVFVGIPTSPLYQWCLNEKCYEYKDDLGLLYLPGFDVKTRYFYGQESRTFVDHLFRKRSEIDGKLNARWRRRKIYRAISSMLPKAIRKPLRPINKLMRKVLGGA
jgi:radical SAM superfamily enzyme YgiQ (UPF0313 family)